MTLVANARMYSATPAVKAAWKQLLAAVLREAGLAWEVIDYDAPAPLSQLWARDDLGLAMMCGLPYAQRGVQPQIIAAPVPSPTRYEGRPVYFTDIVVRADSPWQSIEDSFGSVAGYTLADSMSGGVAFNHFLQRFRTPQRPRLYRRSVGNLINARGVIDALVRGEIDVGPLDSYYHDLLRASDPAYAGQVRILASTPALPIPPLVSTASLREAEIERLRAALRQYVESPQGAPVAQQLLLAGFAVPTPGEYAPLAAMAQSTLHPFEEL
jgi:ABC-type phosphate/phosphonate transport system substrate-binding protein